MDCQTIHEKEVHEKYLLDRLAESEKLEFEQHLARCESCRKELANQRTLIEGLRSLGRVEMKQEIRRQAAAYGSESKVAWAQWMKAAAVLFVVVGTSSIYLVFRDQEPDSRAFVAREVRTPAEELASDEALKEKERSVALERSEAAPESRPTPRQPSSTQKSSPGAGDIKTLSLSKSSIKEEPKAPPPIEKGDRMLSQLPAAKAKPSAVALEEGAATLTGRVTDQTGNPLPGANVVIAGTNLGAATDPSGRYTLAVPTDTLLDRQVTLECHFIGYESRAEEIALQTGVLTRDFALEESALAQDALVVTSAADEAPKQPLSFSRRKVLQKTASATDTSIAPTGVVLLSTARSGQPHKPPARLSFQSGDKTYRVRLVTSKGQPATDEKTGLPVRFPVTIVKKDSSVLEMDWRVPDGFSESRLEGALFQSSKEQLLVVTLKQGSVYRIDLSRDSTEARLGK
jgi:hypothetical protein